MSAATGIRHTRQEHVLVAGAGPAGCAAAVGMARLGYPVTLLHSPRMWNGCEGVSERTLQGLVNAGLGSAAQTAAIASPRQVHWNGEASAANTEHLVLRQAFDAALLEDVQAAGVQLLATRVRDFQEVAGPVVTCEDRDGQISDIPCRFFIDARGRSSSSQQRTRGPGSLSLLQCRRGKMDNSGSQLYAFEQGWSWIANSGDGQIFVQLTVDSDEVQLPDRKGLESWFEQQLAAQPELFTACGNSRPAAPITARGSTSVLQRSLLSTHSLRIGDAAMAVDPLSGNGIFQALSSALAAPAVVNTLLQHPGNAAQARDFYQSRVDHSFTRFTRTGRDFYCLEARWPNSPFWKKRRHWPDDQPSHSELQPTLLGVAEKPVIDNGVIVTKKVAITSDQPLGVWHVAGIELAPLLQDLPENKQESKQLLQQRLETCCNRERPERQALTAWLQRYRAL